MKRLVKTLVALLALTLSSCGNNGPKEINGYIEGDNSHQQMEAKETTTVRFHYHRFDDSKADYSVYKRWSIWAWDMTNNLGGAQYNFGYYDDYGIYTDIVIKEASEGKECSKLGFLVAVLPSWEAKDPGNDRNVEIPSTAPGGIYDVYLKSGSKKIYYDASTPLKPSIDSVTLYADSVKDISVKFDSMVSFAYKQENAKLLLDGNVTNATITKLSDTELKVTLAEDFDVERRYQFSYKFDEEWTDVVDVFYGNYYDTASFKENYTYDGNDLGATFDDEDDPKLTTFKVFAPTSSEVRVKVYDSGDYENDLTPIHNEVMTKGQKGIWEKSFAGNLDGKYYTYEVTNSQGTNEVVDPYAKSAGLNGRRGMVINFKKINEELTGWNEDTRVDYGVNGADASIYEIHVRDMTINPNSNVSREHRGKFLGLTEENTSYTKGDITVSTGLAHLKELGITHVQIQPFYDYSSVDESKDTSAMSDKNYNWGYDPQNYNALEGSYSTDPSHGEVRVKEFKQMVMALHKAGINITMDVVYNHTASTDQSNFQLLVPYFYHRTNESAEFYNGSGCGNEVASERSMVRKFILDSTKFWTKEYHLSGFRFDLMGLLDNQTMIEVYQANKALDNATLIYGEPWTGGTSKLSTGIDANKLDSQQTIKASLYQSYFAGSGNYVGAFSDGFRDGTRGANEPAKGYVQGLSNFANYIKTRHTANFGDNDHSSSPTQVINYVSCHDNYTLYDQLIKTMPKDRDLTNAYNHAEALVFTFQGTPFMQEGEDFMRSKRYADGTYEHNSYNVGDYINNMDYELKADKVDVFNKFKELIALRKAVPELRLRTRAEIDAQVTTSIDHTKGNFSWRIKSADNLTTYMVISALNEAALGGVNGTVLYDSSSRLAANSRISVLDVKQNQLLVIRLG